MEGRLAIDRNGEWVCDGVQVTHPGTRRFLFEHLVRDEEGTLLVRCGADSRAVDVADVPFIVRAVRLPGPDDPAGEIQVVLQDGARETLNPESLRIDGEGALYVRVQAERPGGPYEARFSRPALHTLGEQIEEDGEGRFVLRFRGKAWLIR